MQRNFSAPNQAAEEAAELAMGINASVPSAIDNRQPLYPHNSHTSGSNNINSWGESTNEITHNGWASFGRTVPSEARSNGWIDEPAREGYNGCGMPEAKPVSNKIQDANDTSHGRWVDEPEEDRHNGCSMTESTPLSDPAHGNDRGLGDKPANEKRNGWGVPEPSPASNPAQDVKDVNHGGCSSLVGSAPPEESSGGRKIRPEPASNSSQETGILDNIPIIVQTKCAIPSAPSIPEGPIHNPSIDLGPVDLSISSMGHEAFRTGGSGPKDGYGFSCCSICWEAPVEGACIPCGHMAGCMGCLNEIKTKNGECPVCRSKIDHIIRIYAV